MTDPLPFPVDAIPVEPPRQARRVAVIGGGPAGLMAAEVLSANGFEVAVHDRMPSVGRKLLIAGRGGLNLTHTEEMEAFLTRYGPAGERLAEAIHAFSPEALRAWCESLGVPTFVGTSGRVFPRSLKASPLLRAWLARLAAQGVAFRLRRRFEGLCPDTGEILLAGPDGERERESADAVVLALGGASWPRLGSDGAWTAAIERLGVRVEPLAPSNMGVLVPWTEVFRSRHEGEPLKRIALTHGERTARGEGIVTRDGLEGGAVYALSGPIRDAVRRDGSAPIFLNLRPDIAPDALLKRLSAPRGTQSASNFLRKAAGLPPVAIGLLREAAGPSLPTRPEALARLIQALPLTVTGIRPVDRAISSAGGVPLDELDGRFMLRRRPGVFLAGEMIDWEAPTGGYLLQAVFATGAAAARGVSEWLAEGGRC